MEKGAAPSYRPQHCNGLIGYYELNRISQLSGSHGTTERDLEPATNPGYFLEECLDDNQVFVGVNAAPNSKL